MEQPTASRRIEFIDLAKGVCIILVVLNHVGVNVSIPGLQGVRTPLYFVLSGLFFKTYGSCSNLAIKKVDKLIIPFLFFYITSYIIYYIVEWLRPGLIQTDATGILDVFTQTQWFNGPIWFLLALFWCNMAFGVISLFIKNELARAAIIAFLAAASVALAHYDIFVPMNIHSAMSALPLFYIGYLLKKTPILYKNDWDKYNWLIAISLYTVAVTVNLWWGTQFIDYHANDIYGNYVLSNISSLISVLAVLMICKIIGHLPFVSYFGRFSIVTLCTHHMIYRPVAVVITSLGINPLSGWTNAIITLFICWACIPILTKYFPHVTAQKDVFKIN